MLEDTNLLDAAQIWIMWFYQNYYAEQCVQKMQMEWQTLQTPLHQEQSDLSLDCLLRPVSVIFFHLMGTGTGTSGIGKNSGVFP